MMLKLNKLMIVKTMPELNKQLEVNDTEAAQDMIKFKIVNADEKEPEIREANGKKEYIDEQTNE